MKPFLDIRKITGRFVGNNFVNKCEKELHEISLASYTCFHEFSKNEKIPQKLKTIT
jgi:hypothetical protein